MQKYEIKDIELLKVEKKYYGFSQEWYKESLQRRAGCGATVAATILIYYKQKESFESLKVEDSLFLMEELWTYLFPTKRGLNSTRLFYEGLERYCLDKKEEISYTYLDIDIEKKISIHKVIAYIEENLKNDIPIAFLNLCNGAEINLDRWHWVTVYGIYLDKDDYFLEILDDRKKKKINLTLWYNTISNNAGFVSFKIKGGKK